MRRGHHNAADSLGAKRVDGKQGNEGGVDAAGERHADLAEAVLQHVVAQAEGERRVDLGQVGQRLGQLARPGGGELANEQLLLELGGAGDHLAGRVDDDAVAVEDELILAADQVAEGEAGAAFAGALGEHRFALATLAAVVGRARRVGDQARTGRRLARRWRARHPDVLTDRQANRRPADLDRRRLDPGDEVALLVEDRVVGQPALTVDGAHRTLAEHRERVVGLAGIPTAGDRLGEADQGDDLADVAGELLDRPAVRLDEVALQVEVLGGVARQAELGEDHQLGSLGAGAADPLGDLRCVAVEVADGRVDLGQGYAHAGFRGRVTAEVSPPRPALAFCPADPDKQRTRPPERAWPACRLPRMRAGWRLVGASLASVALLSLLPAVAAAGDERVFRAPAARPTDDPDPNRNAYTVPEAPKSPACTRHFCVHWVAEGIDAPSLLDAERDGVPDYVEKVQAVAEHVYEIENGKLGWRDPKSDGRKGGGNGKTDVYLDQIGGALFGYAAPDRGQATKEHRLPRRLHGYLVLDNDYDPREFPGTVPQEDLEVTFAHEYNHILQFGYDAYQDAWFAESSAVWMEDQVYDRIDDYRRYVRRWVKRYDTPLTANSIKEYGSAVWAKWLARRYERAIVRRAWARALYTKPGGFSVAAYDAAIAMAGGSDFARDFARFARDLPEWRTDEVFTEGHSYPDVSRQGSLPLNGRRLERRLNHTTFQLLRLRPRSGRALVVRAAAPRGVSAGLALVGRIGSERQGRTVSTLRFARQGGQMAVRISRPGRFDRLTAVLVNADTSVSGFSVRWLDWAYLTDSAPFRVSAELIR